MADAAFVGLTAAAARQTLPQQMRRVLSTSTSRPLPRRSAGAAPAGGAPFRMVAAEPVPSGSPAPNPPSPPSTRLISHTPEWAALLAHKREVIDPSHLRELLTDVPRTMALYAEHDGVSLDYARQRVTVDTMRLLFDLAKAANLQGKMAAMARGDRINKTEDRSVLHMALRAAKGDTLMVDGVDVNADVWNVLDRIRTFTERVRSGEHRGATGKVIKNVIAVGIGGSYLGPDFVHEALKTDRDASKAAGDRTLRFLSNVDPVDVLRNTRDLDPEETVVVVISKTFTTRETKVNAKTLRDWLRNSMGRAPEVVAQHMVACSTNMEGTSEFGISPENVFPFWDWVGGRFSVCSSVGALPIALQYGFDSFERFLEGARSMDQHWLTAPMERNLPVLMGLLGVWNMSFLGYSTRALHPYTEALLKFPAHVQQVDMESNGKHVTLDGDLVDYPVGEVDFGEPGTNGQHSFFQLLHMGQTVPCDFIGFMESQNPICEEGEPVSNHDELVANFFAQPDALANGKTADECRAEGRAEELVPHVTFLGNRPSVSLLLPICNAYSCGQLLALYEHRTAVEGFIWNINSFDQWGVELGKVLAIKVRQQINQTRYHNRPIKETFNASTTRLLDRFLNGSVGCAFEDIVVDE